MTKRKSDANVPLPPEYHDDDAQLQDEMDALVKETFPPPPWAHADLIFVQLHLSSPRSTFVNAPSPLSKLMPELALV
jgi:hypothetical protein